MKAPFTGMSPGALVEMIYLDEAGRFSQRKVKIAEVSETGVLGYCMTRKAFRRFRFDHMLSAFPIREGGAKRNVVGFRVRDAYARTIQPDPRGAFRERV